MKQNKNMMVAGLEISATQIHRSHHTSVILQTDNHDSNTIKYWGNPENTYQRRLETEGGFF
jgi:ribosome-associated toxin RatA of RatAB toxin-antitoxin module